MIFDPALIQLAEQCAPMVSPQTMAALVATESSGNPYAIGVVDLQLAAQPQTKATALAQADALIRGGANISVGLGQVNMHNFKALGLTLDTAFDSCPNMRAAGEVLSSCYERAIPKFGAGQESLKAAFSCYYSNNFTRGFKDEGDGKGSYVARIAAANETAVKVPEIKFSASDIKEVGTTKEINKDVVAVEDLSSTKEKQSTSWDVLDDFPKPKTAKSE